jgi:NAD-dependent SIR2 family protein deacetylase
MANTTVRMDLIGKVDTQPPFSLTGIHNKSTMDDSRTSSAADVKPSSSSSSAAAAATSLSSEGAKHNQQQQPSVPTFEESFEGVARLLRDKKNILALVGAGISTSIGIPDFRSKDGIYHSEELQALGLSAPEDLFDMEFFEHNPAPFYRFARNLYRPQSKPLWTTAMTKTRTKTAAATTANATTTSTTIRPSDSHKFLALLEKRKMLLRVYTQNIDGLEEMAGVSEKKVVYAHGSIRYVQVDEVECDGAWSVWIMLCVVEGEGRQSSNDQTSLAVISSSKFLFLRFQYMTGMRNASNVRSGSRLNRSWMISCVDLWQDVDNP